MVLKCAVADSFFKNMPDVPCMYNTSNTMEVAQNLDPTFCVTALTNVLVSLETGMWNFTHRCDHTCKICRIMLRDNSKIGGKLTYTYTHTHTHIHDAFNTVSICSSLH